MRVALWILCFTVFTIASELLFNILFILFITCKFVVVICNHYVQYMLWFRFHKRAFIATSACFRNRGLWSPYLRTTPLLGHLQRQGSHFRSFWRWAPVDIDHIEWIDYIKSIFQRKKSINDSDTGFVGWQECFWCLAGFGSTATGLVPRKQHTRYDLLVIFWSTWQMRLLKPLLPPLCKHGAARPTWQRRWLPPTLQTRHSAADVRSNAQNSSMLFELTEWVS